MSEMEIIHVEKNNLIIHSLPEKESPEEDYEVISELFKHEFELSAKISKVTHLGKRKMTNLAYYVQVVM